MKESNFEFFTKNKIEGLQHIVGGMNATVVVGGNRPEYLGHGDTWYDSTENKQTSNSTDITLGKTGDRVIAIAAPGGHDQGFVDAPEGTQYRLVD